ncbi:MAG: hypothetical protein WAT39_21160 [Planctomycetota bacterium]
MNRPAGLLALLLLSSAAAGQQWRWQVPTPPSANWYHEVAPYADFNGDGDRDLLVLLLLRDGSPGAINAHRIVSGRDGTPLWERIDPIATNMVDGGDIDGDGVHDIVMRHDVTGTGLAINAWSVGNSTWLWQVAQPWWGFGDAMLGNIDLNGDSRPDFVTSSQSSLGSDIFAYDHLGQLRYTIPCFSQGLVASSFANMGDMDGDGGEDFVVGCQDTTARGACMLVSGRTGAILRVSYGLLPGDIIANHASNMGDMDGDGVPDYAGFPWHSASRAMITVFSGQTGAVIRTWPDYANAVIAGEDIDLDGVPDLVFGADYQVSTWPAVWGRTFAFSGRDGTELWRVSNFQAPPGTGNNGSNGWMYRSASLGVPSGGHYPRIAWLDQQWWTVGTRAGRYRAYDTQRAGQGPITGTACSSTNQKPLIGARQTATGSRVTIAKAPPGAVAWLNLSLASQTSYAGINLPIDLGFLGFSECRIQVAPTASAVRVLGTTGINRGYAAVDLPFNLTTATVGIPLAAQWLVFEPTWFDYAVTARHELRGQ